MIKPHQFIGLAAASAVSVLLAVGLYASSNRWSAGKVEGEAFLPDLAQRINSVGAIEVTQGDRTLTIAREGGAWKVRDRSGFPASAEQARSLLVALAQSQLIEPRTSIKDKLAMLELEEPGKEAKSRRVRVLDTAGKAISDVIVGKSRVDAFGSGKGGIYVRRASETQSWLATGDPKASADIKDWIDTKVFTGEPAKVVKVTIESPGEQALVLEKAPPAEAKPEDAKAPPKPPGSAEKESKYRLASMPDGKKLKQDAKLDDIVEAFGSINLDDVRKLEAPPAADKAQTIKVESEGWPTVTFRLRKDGDASWLSLAAAGEGDAKKKADEINAKAQGWEFKIPNWKAEQIGKRAADLFDAKEFLMKPDCTGASKVGFDLWTRLRVCGFYFRNMPPPSMSIMAPDRYSTCGAQHMTARAATSSGFLMRLNGRLPSVSSQRFSSPKVDLARCREMVMIRSVSVAAGLMPKTRTPKSTEREPIALVKALRPALPVEPAT